jgi:hypothetical protein
MGVSLESRMSSRLPDCVGVTPRRENGRVVLPSLTCSSTGGGLFGGKTRKDFVSRFWEIPGDRTAQQGCGSDLSSRRLTTDQVVADLPQFGKDDLPPELHAIPSSTSARSDPFSRIRVRRLCHRLLAASGASPRRVAASAQVYSSNPQYETTSVVERRRRYVRKKGRLARGKLRRAFRRSKAPFINRWYAGPPLRCSPRRRALAAGRFRNYASIERRG